METKAELKDEALLSGLKHDSKWCLGPAGRQACNTMAETLQIDVLEMDRKIKIKMYQIDCGLLEEGK